jgi:hypothetical protein
MVLGVTVGTEELALAHLFENLRPSQLRERSHVQLQDLLPWIDLVQ